MKNNKQWVISGILGVLIIGTLAMWQTGTGVFGPHGLTGSVGDLTAATGPVFTTVPTADALIAGRNTIYAFSVAAPAGHDVGFSRFVFDVNQTGLSTLDQIGFGPMGGTELTPGNAVDVNQVYLKWDAGTTSCFAQSPQAGPGTGMDCAANVLPAGKLIVSFPTEEVVAAGKTNTYEISANLAAASGTGDATVTVGFEGSESTTPDKVNTVVQATTTTSQPPQTVVQRNVSGGGGATNNSGNYGGGGGLGGGNNVVATQQELKKQSGATDKTTAEKPANAVTAETQAPSFKDVKATDPNAKAIAYVQEKGIVKGYADGTFKPKNTINRAELTKIIIESNFDAAAIDDCLNKNIKAEWTYVFFKDVPREAWYAKYICMAKTNNIVGGYPDATFRGDQKISFAEAAKILASAKGLSVTAAGNVWYAPYVQALSDLKAIPTSIVAVNKTITRSEMVEMIYRLDTQDTTLSSKAYSELVNPS